MRLHRFYIGGENGRENARAKSLDGVDKGAGIAYIAGFGSEKICLDGIANDNFAILIHQWKDVFRYTVGSRVLLFDDSKTEYLCMIEAFAGAQVTLVVLEKNKASRVGAKKAEDTESPSKTNNELWLFLSILKNDNFDLVIQKATELGVDHIVPLLTDRTIKKNINMKRAEKIAIEAAEQSGRVSIPSIHEPTVLKNAIDDFMALGGEVLVCHQKGNVWSKVKPALKKYPLGFIVGPEGGWSEKEEKLFEKLSLKKVKFSENVLRAETAAIGVITLAMVG